MDIQFSETHGNNIDNKLNNLIKKNRSFDFCWYCKNCNKYIDIKNLYDVILHDNICETI